MSKIKLANELKRLLPGQHNSRIRQAIMEAYQRATGAPSLNPEYYQSNITEIVQTIVNEIAVQTDYVVSEGTIRFDVARSYGYNGTPVTGNMVISLTDAKDMYMAKVLHNGSVEPAISVPSGVALVCDRGEYDPGVNNYYWLVITKDDAGQVIELHYSITQNQL